MENKIFSIRDSIAVFSKRKNVSCYIVSFLFQSSRIVVSFETGTLTFECIKLFDGFHTIKAIAGKTGVSIPEIKSLVRSLKKENIIMEVSTRNLKEKSRYNRQLNFFASFETEKILRERYLEKLENATVTILGIGGIGSWLAESLVRSGVGRLQLIDPDIVDLSNLPRQALYSENDIGKFKVEAAKDKLMIINSRANIEGARKFITSPSELLPFIENSTLVINCSDSPSVSDTNDIVSEACFKLNIPHLLCGGYDGHLSFVGQTVIPYKTACWKCYSESGIYEKSLRGFSHVSITSSSLEGGTLAPIASITANLHAIEAIRVISGYGKPTMTNCKAELDFSSFMLHKTRVRKRKNCSLCGQNIQPTKGAKNEV
jgi:molybdopterin/thiamine biosynthesis adenylyltransferase